jgi:hypothetical protein
MRPGNADDVSPEISRLISSGRNFWEAGENHETKNKFLSPLDPGVRFRLSRLLRALVYARACGDEHHR